MGLGWTGGGGSCAVRVRVVRKCVVSFGSVGRGTEWDGERAPWWQCSSLSWPCTEAYTLCYLPRFNPLRGAEALVALLPPLSKSHLASSPPCFRAWLRPRPLACLPFPPLGSSPASTTAGTLSASGEWPGLIASQTLDLPIATVPRAKTGARRGPKHIRTAEAA